MNHDPRFEYAASVVGNARAASSSASFERSTTVRGAPSGFAPTTPTDDNAAAPPTPARNVRLVV
ncbi:hypothetical protein Hbor_16850 [Halogeometricum borinquense DSM 11551]|uniref:Uncharacterized protein n=1 Tax=Halogeometricum borinquense (strain ATCC 700274 / DSM 11551 / JCM 10706 / KCTC 4070 / PR3) TaxID=469382 RepID=E4NLQ0_HALBP|nr:hypothetical protein Hbor_16850 [Halogeometricum borinquense DSM 11551]